MLPSLAHVSPLRQPGFPWRHPIAPFRPLLLLLPWRPLLLQSRLPHYAASSPVVPSRCCRCCSLELPPPPFPFRPHARVSSRRFRHCSPPTTHGKRGKRRRVCGEEASEVGIGPGRAPREERETRSSAFEIHMRQFGARLLRLWRPSWPVFSPSFPRLLATAPPRARAPTFARIYSPWADL